MKKIRMISNLICLILIIVYSVYLILSWKSIPETIATHFNLSGVADGYGSKMSLLMESIMAVVLFGLFIFAEHFPRLWNFPVRVTEENRSRLYFIAGCLIVVIKVLTVVTLIYAGIRSLNPPAPTWPVFMLIMLVFVSVAIGIAAMIRNR